MDSPQYQRLPAWPTVFIINSLIWALIISAAISYEGLNWSLSETATVRLLCGSLILVTIWCIWSWRALTGSLFDPYVLFLAAAVLFNGGHALLQLFGANEHGILNGTFTSETIVQTLFLVVLAVSAFHTGGLLSIPASKRRLSIGEAEEGNTEQTAYALRLVGWGLMAISFVPATLVLKDGIVLAMTSGYFATMTEETATGFSSAPTKLADFIIPAVIFLLAGSKNHRLNVAFATALVLIYSSSMFLIGARHGAALLLIAYAWVYHRCLRPLPRMLLLGSGAFLLLVVFPLVRVSRDTVLGGARFSPQALVDTFLSVENPIADVLSEMGNSMQVTAYTLHYVPTYRAFDMGTSYLYSLISIFPNLFWEEHPTYEHGTLSDWFVRTVEAGFATSQGYFGLGFSFIAEAYLNFGWYGAPVVLGVMGLLLGKFVLWAHRSADPAKIAAVGAFTGFFLIFARAESNDVVRYLVWYSLIPYLGVCLTRLLVRSKTHRAGDPREAENRRTSESLITKETPT